MLHAHEEFFDKSYQFFENIPEINHNEDINYPRSYRQRSYGIA